jgi:small subunit ribosomal protein S17e
LDKTRRLSEMLLQRYPGTFGTDYEENKTKLNELTVITSKQLRNHIAGYISRSLKSEEVEEAEATATPEEPKAE